MEKEVKRFANLRLYKVVTSALLVKTLIIKYMIKFIKSIFFEKENKVVMLEQNKTSSYQKRANSIFDNSIGKNQKLSKKQSSVFFDLICDEIEHQKRLGINCIEVRLNEYLERLNLKINEDGLTYDDICLLEDEILSVKKTLSKSWNKGKTDDQLQKIDEAITKHQLDYEISLWNNLSVKC